MVSILYYPFIEFFILSYIVIFSHFFAWYTKYMIWKTSISTFSDVLPAVTCNNAIVNLWNICLGVNIVIPSPWVVLYLASEHHNEI